MKVIFFGTPDFAAKILTDLLDHSVDIVAVITKPDKAKGRSKELIPTPVKVVIQERDNEIPVFQPEIVSSSEFTEILKEFKADLFIVVAYGEILKQNILDIPPLGCINIHASLLPKLRGAAPIQRAIIQGEKKTGITLIHMARKMDAGDIIAMEKISIPLEMTYGELEQELCQLGSDLLIQELVKIEKKTSLRTPQNHLQATLAPKIELEDCEINWSDSAENIHNLVRGVNPEPGAWCYIQVRGEKKRLKIFKTYPRKEFSGKPGQLISKNKSELIVCCGTDAIQILEVQLEGKKRMMVTDLLKGFLPEYLVFSDKPSQTSSSTSSRT